MAPGYWIDIGTIEKYLQVHLDLIEGRTPFKPGPGARLLHNSDGAKVVAGPGVKVAPFVRFSGAVSLGRGVHIGKGAQLSDCVVLDGAQIGDGADWSAACRRPRAGTHATLARRFWPASRSGTTANCERQGPSPSPGAGSDLRPRRQYAGKILIIKRPAPQPAHHRRKHESLFVLKASSPCG